jgi:hypothetical protein
MRGFFENRLQIRLDGSGLVSHGLKSCSCQTAFAQYCGRHLFTGPASGGNAQRALQFPEILYSGLCGLADLLVGYSVANTDVHNFLIPLRLDDIQSQMRMIVNSITYKPRHGRYGIIGCRAPVTKVLWPDPALL